MGKRAAARRTGLLAAGATAGVLSATGSALAADASASRVTGYEYRVTGASGVLTAQRNLDSPGYFSHLDGRVEILGTRSPRGRDVPPDTGTAYFNRTFRRPERGNSGAGSFLAAGPFAASLRSSVGNCDGGYEVLDRLWVPTFRFYTRGSKVLVDFGGNDTGLECSMQPLNLLRTALHRKQQGSDFYSTLLTVPKRKFSKRKFTLRFENVWSETESDGSSSVTDSADGRLTIRFKRTKVLRR